MRKYLLFLIIILSFIKSGFSQTNALYPANQSGPGGYNTFLGFLSGNVFTTSSENTFLGSHTGKLISNGSYNLFAGSFAGGGNTSGSFNVLVGYGSGYENTTGSGNTFLGVGAGNGISGVPNTANVSGNNNTYIGNQASAIGNLASQISNSTALGWNAKVSVNNAIVLGDTINNIKVGIGMTNPIYPLDVKGVVNMRIAYNNPALRINNKEFLGIDDKGTFTLANFKLRYTSIDQWADSVFDSDKKPMNLSEVSNYINQYKHLPEIPSAKEVVANGVEVNAIIAKLLKKVEELTLYTIEQKNEIQELKNMVNKLNTSQNLNPATLPK